MINESQQLSERERQILHLVATGRSNQQIANELGISVNTVKVHLRNVFGKIGAASRTEASMYAVRAGIVTVDRVIDARTTGEVEAPLVPTDKEVVVEQFGAPTSTSEDMVDVLPEAVARPQDLESLPVATPARSDAPEPQPAAVTAVVEQAAQPARTPMKPRSTRMFVLLALCLVLVALGGIAVTWLVRLNQRVDDQAQDVERFNLARWRELPALPTPRAGFAVAAIEDQLFVIAGENESGVLNTVARFDTSSQNWVALAHKPNAVTDVRAAKLGEKLYVPGGRRSADAKDISATVERYDPDTNQWEKLADLPQPRSGYALTALEGKLYLFGGWDGTAYRDEVFAYDPKSNTWTELESMPTARAFASAAVIEDSIVVVGGENKAGPVASSEQYTPSQEGTRPWVNRPPMPSPRSHISAAVALSNIYVFGGDNAADSLQYDARDEQWEAFKAPGVIGSRPGVVLLDDTIMIMGGQVGAGAYSTKFYTYQALFRTLLPGS